MDSFRDRAKYAVQSPRPVDRLWRHVFGVSKSQKDLRRTTEPQRKQYQKQRIELQRNYNKQRLAVRHFFALQKNKEQFKEIRKQLKMTDQEVGQDPVRVQEKILEKLRKEHVYAMGDLKRRHQETLKRAGREFRKNQPTASSISTQFSQPSSFNQSSSPRRQQGSSNRYSGKA